MRHIQTTRRSRLHTIAWVGGYYANQALQTLMQHDPLCSMDSATGFTIEDAYSIAASYHFPDKGP
eukprot:2621485-Amphidinium_carterae.1